MQHREEIDMGLVERDKPKGENLGYLRVDNLLLLIIHSRMDLQDNGWTENFVPSIDHPDDPSRVYLARPRNLDVGKAGNTAEGVLEGNIRGEVRFYCASLLLWRALSEGVDYR